MSVFRTLFRSIRHPQNSGQAIIVLALGFIGLIGFVGIVTDVSILLARYNTLARAVDSAAISAAGQMRSDRSFAEVGLAARMMLELHTVDSTEVLVETCASTNETDPTLCSEANRYRKLVRVGARVMSPTVFLRLLGIEDIEISAVSTSETAVLDIVMVMDVSESMLLDTTYQDWANIGMGQVYVPPNLGTSEHVTGQPATSVLHRKQIANYFNGPSSIDPTNIIPDQYEFWGMSLLGSVMSTPRIYPEQVNRRLNYVTTANAPVVNAHAATADPDYKVVSYPYPGSTGTQEHPRTACRVRFWPYSTQIKIPQTIRQLPGYAGLWEGANSYQMNDLSQDVLWGGVVPTYDFYGCCNDPSYGGQVSSSGGLSPIPGQTIDYSSEHGDFKFNDLICQPFKQARDAAREFLNTIDFDRGDRVAFVTFDRGAFLIDPDGSGGKVYNAAEACPRDPAPASNRTTWTHMSASLCRAQNTLDQHVGVRAEPNFYQWNENGGGWLAFAKGRRDDGTSLLVDYFHEGAPKYADFSDPNDAIGDGDDRALTDYPVRDFCPFNDAAVGGPASLYTLWDWNLSNLQYLGFSVQPGLKRIMTPTPGANGWSSGLGPNQSYEMWASCRGTNIGAGLREGNNALLDPTTTRRTGTVWVMIMLSDGAAGASDPVRLNGRKSLETEPFYDYGSDRINWQDYAGISDLVRYGRPGEYGAFGLCPLGTPSSPSQLTLLRAPEFPYCSDTDPSTRHFCKPFNGDVNNVGIKCPSGTGHKGAGFAPGSFDEDYDCNILLDENLIMGRIYDVDIGNFPNETSCDPLYDVDDYARDWADHVGLSRTGAGDEQLPTIFTIGFGLNFLRQDSRGYIDPTDDPSSPSYTPYSAQYNVADFLGEELLRYIADVGDNFQVDTDYQQDLRQDNVLHGYMSSSGTESFGIRGACEDQTLTPADYIGNEGLLRGNGRATSDGGTGRMIRPLPQRQDCGNYYNAPDQGRLQLVFDDIATRMFTRLAP